MLTIRLDLRPSGRVVLINVSGRLEPFRIVNHDPNNGKVNGMWLLTDEISSINGSTPTVDFTKEWLDFYINELHDEINKGKNRVDRLEDLFNLLK